MPTADIVLLVVLVLSALMGLARGLLKEVISLATWIAAVVLALFFAPATGDLLANQIEDPMIRRGVAFASIFVVTLIAGGLLQWLVGTLVRTTGLTGTDRLLGFLFGAGRGVLVCLVVLIAIRSFAVEADWWQASRLIPVLLAYEGDLLDLLGKSTDWLSTVGNGD